MKIKKSIAIIALGFISLNNFAQQETKINTKVRGNDFAIGYCLNQFGKDFGITQFTGPVLVKDI